MQLDFQRGSRYDASMKIAVLSDIHGNLEAFQSVLAKLDTRSFDCIISLGDNIGYGPDPQAVMELLSKHDIRSVLGNHEMVIKDQRFMKWFNPKVQKSISFTCGQLSEDSIKTILGFPKSIILENTRFVHGCPDHSPFLYLFQLTESGLKKKMARMPQAICFIGHTHELGITTYDPTQNTVTESPLDPGITMLDPDKKYIINAGSVGQPRDPNKDAKVVIVDTGSLALEVLFISYDRHATIDKINRHGLNPSFAEKLIQPE